MEISQIDPNDFVMLAGDKVVTDSRRVAAAFGKQHYHVLRDIRNLMADLPEEDRQSNFGETVESRPNPSGGKPITSIVYQMTKNGFLWLVMGFRGKKAMSIKVAYTKAFDAMAEALKGELPRLWQEAIRAEAAVSDQRGKGSFHGRGLRQHRIAMPPLIKRRDDAVGRVQQSLLLAH